MRHCLQRAAACCVTTFLIQGAASQAPALTDEVALSPTYAASCLGGTRCLRGGRRLCADSSAAWARRPVALRFDRNARNFNLELRRADRAKRKHQESRAHNICYALLFRRREYRHDGGGYKAEASSPNQQSLRSLPLGEVLRELR